MAESRTTPAQASAYHTNVSPVFFQQLGLPQPDINLEAGPSSHAQQTAQLMARFEPVVLPKGCTRRSIVAHLC